MNATLTIECYTQEQMKLEERNLKSCGYRKTNDCMWVKIYVLGELEVVLSRQF